MKYETIALCHQHKLKYTRTTKVFGDTENNELKNSRKYNLIITKTMHKK